MSLTPAIGWGGVVGWVAFHRPRRSLRGRGHVRLRADELYLRLLEERLSLGGPPRCLPLSLPGLLFARQLRGLRAGVTIDA